MRPFSALRRAALFLFALPLLAACIYDPMETEEAEGTAVGPGDALPEFTVTLSDGSTLSTGNLTGTVSLIMFFSTQCPDCQEVLPEVQSLYEEFGTKVRFVLISRAEGAESIEEYWQEHDLTLHYSAQSGREVYSLFAGGGIPRIYISGEDLIIRSVFTDSPLPTLSDLREALAFCLR